mgnify:CR=1 FL=1|jgi:hypothetical protein
MYAVYSNFDTSTTAMDPVNRRAKQLAVTEDPSQAVAIYKAEIAAGKKGMALVDHDTGEVLA